MKEPMMLQIRTGEEKRETVLRLGILLAVLSCLLAACSPFPVLAAPNTGAISNSFKSIYNIIAAIVTSIGQLYLLWGVFEWATSLNSQDGTAQSMAFKRIAAGLVACMAPTIISMISY